jgi:hypothetical protein
MATMRDVRDGLQGLSEEIREANFGFIDLISQQLMLDTGRSSEEIADDEKVSDEVSALYRSLAIQQALSEGNIEAARLLMRDEREISSLA